MLAKAKCIAVASRVLGGSSLAVLTRLSRGSWLALEKLALGD